jgi:cell division protein FtsI/penicillin-binding protein 2
VRPAGRIAAALLAISATLSGCSLFGADVPKSGPAAQAFLDAWARGDLTGAAAATDQPALAQEVLTSVQSTLGRAKVELQLGEVSEDKTTKGRATAAFTASWTLPGVAEPWRYDGSLALNRREDKSWIVHWQPSDVHPDLGVDEKIELVRTMPERAALQDAAGQPLFRRTEVVTVGVEPRRVKDLQTLAGALAKVLKISGSDIVSDVRKAKPTAFVPVVTLRRPQYEQVKPLIYDLPGAVFRAGELLLAPTSQFAQPLLGRVGEATAEVLKEAGGQYQAGDQLGVTGLQRALNGTLTGTPGVTIRTVKAASAPGKTLATFEPKPGTPVRTTLDRRVQLAADAAVASQRTPTAIVAVRPSTGAILAVANNEAAPYDIALTGRFPAGSTFKMVSAAALLSAGVVQPSSVVDCPGTTTVYGKRFQNENQFALGRVPLRTAFAKSCNTTFTMLAQRLGNEALGRAAAAFGVGSAWTLPVDSFGGSVPVPKDDVEKAADAIGQGRVEVSPLAMALVAASVQRGAEVTPSLLAGRPATPKAGAPDGPPAPVLPELRAMMRAVVTGGTATALATVPGGPVAGKTGTAEYGTAVPPRSHAWFAGYQGDLAFAVFVLDGHSSKTTAVPVARAFLTSLAG